MKRKLNNEELITFCSQMALILKSGISSLEGIYIMEDGDVSGDGREILKEIREEIEMCGMLYPAMKKSGVFPEYALHMTEIGEQTGRLDETMEALAAYYQREEEIFEAVKSAVTYPVAMLGMMLVIIIVLFIKVMPVFEQVYLQLGQEMTGVARNILNIGNWMRQSAIILSVIAVIVLMIVCSAVFSEKFRNKLFEKISKIGFMKKLAWKRARTRFAKFFNLPELMNMFKEVADIKTSDQLHLPVPEAKFETVVVQPSEHQQAMVAELSERAAAWAAPASSFL